MDHPVQNPDEVDELRAGATELENHAIDEFLAGRISRRDFLLRGSMLGISLPALSVIQAARGGGGSTSLSRDVVRRSAKRSATIRVADQVPAATPNPLLTTDNGGEAVVCQTCEYLCRNDSLAGVVRPVLATSWSPNSDGSQWTFKLRPNVHFSNGKPMTADDVVYSFREQCDPKNASNALSVVFGGLLRPSGVEKVDHLTVRFHLESPTGSFPYLVCATDNWDMIIVPNGTDFSTWVNTMIGTGPLVRKSYTTNVGASFVANPHWWNGQVNSAGVDFLFYQNQQSQVLALEGGEVDVIVNMVYEGAQALFNNPAYSVVALPSSSHRELSMRTDKPPFNDRRVRQAIALTLDRPAIAKALFGKYAQVGNDSVFAPAFPSTNTKVPQRHQDLAKAKQLLAAAGYPHGFHATMYTEQYQEIPQLAQIVAASAAKIGVTINLIIESQNAYYGKSTLGHSDWLDGEMSLGDYAARGVPNTDLTAIWASTGAWNASRYHNPTLDRLIKQYTSTVDLSSQRTIAGKIETLLLDETPVIVPYFFDELNVTTRNISGVEFDPGGLLFMGKASKA